MKDYKTYNVNDITLHYARERKNSFGSKFCFFNALFCLYNEGDEKQWISLLIITQLMATKMFSFFNILTVDSC